jgi:hypothetical protein
MLNKEVCFKCHMKHYGVDGTNSSGVKCYPPPNESDKKQCEQKFEQEWNANQLWCWGLDMNATNAELEEIFSPFVDHRTHVATKFCDYLSEQVEKKS